MAQKILTHLLFCLGVIRRLVGRSVRQFIGRRIGDLMLVLSASRRRITLENITMAFPQESSIWYRRVARDSYHNLGVTLLELMAFASMDDAQLEAAISFENLELIQDACAAGNGVILLSAHFGNWELPAFAVPRKIGQPLNVIIKHQRNHQADRMLNAIRASRGNKLIPMDRAAREAVRIFRSGGVLALLADQSARPGSDPFLPIFGRPAPVYRAPAALALRFGVPIVMGLSTRNNNGTYTVKLVEVSSQDLENNETGILELTRRHLSLMEEHIRLYPGQWVWQHRRWKHKLPSDYANTDQPQGTQASGSQL